MYYKCTHTSTNASSLFKFVVKEKVNCTADLCDNGGKCLQDNDYKVSCQCDMTTYTGSTCSQGEYNYCLKFMSQCAQTGIFTAGLAFRLCKVDASLRAQTFVMWSCGTLMITKCHNSTQHKPALLNYQTRLMPISPVLLLTFRADHI